MGTLPKKESKGLEKLGFFAQFGSPGTNREECEEGQKTAAMTAIGPPYGFLLERAWASRFVSLGVLVHRPG